MRYLLKVLKTTQGAGNVAASDNSEGFSSLSLEAAINGGLTVADQPTDDNSLGLDIEYVGS